MLWTITKQILQQLSKVNDKMQRELGFQKNLQVNLILWHLVHGQAKKGRRRMSYVDNFLEKQSPRGVL